MGKCCTLIVRGAWTLGSCALGCHGFLSLKVMNTRIARFFLTEICILKSNGNIGSGTQGCVSLQDLDRMIKNKEHERTFHTSQNAERITETTTVPPRYKLSFTTSIEATGVDISIAESCAASTPAACGLNV